MNLKDKRFGIIKIVAFYTALVLGYGLFLFRPALQRIHSIDVKIKGSRAGLDEYLHTTGNLPAYKFLPLLTGRNQDLKNLLHAYETYLNTTLPESFDTQLNTQKPSLYFKQKLEEVRKDIQTRASKAEVFVFNSLGFNEEIPDEDQIPQLLIRLALAKKITECGIESRLSHVDVIDFNQPQSKESLPDVGLLYRQIPVYLELTTSIPSFLKFLYGVQTPPGSFVIKSIEITVAGEELKVKMLLAALVFHQGER